MPSVSVFWRVPVMGDHSTPTRPVGTVAQPTSDEPGIGEHARHGRCRTRLASSLLRVNIRGTVRNRFTRSVFSARTRKTAPEAGALPISTFEFGGQGRNFLKRPLPRSFCLAIHFDATKMSRLTTLAQRPFGLRLPRLTQTVSFRSGRRVADRHRQVACATRVNADADGRGI